MPFVVLGLLLGLGLWGVSALKANRADSNRQAAVWNAENAAAQLSLDIYKAAIPLNQMEAMVRRNLSVSAVLRSADLVGNGRGTLFRPARGLGLRHSTQRHGARLYVRARCSFKTSFGLPPLQERLQSASNLWVSITPVDAYSHLDYAHIGICDLVCT